RAAGAQILLSRADIRKIHWDGTGRMLAGVAFVSWSVARTAWVDKTLLVLPQVIFLAVLAVALAGLVARGGVARPDLDVLRLTVHWLNREFRIPAISLGASVLQLS